MAFDRMMEAYKIDKTRRVFKQAPQLSGKAQQAYSVLPTYESSDYDLVKAAILRRYNINEETYRVCFRSAQRKQGEIFYYS